MINPNLEILRLVVEKLGSLADSFVFVGGCTIGLLITDEGSVQIRPTKDVDGIIQAVTYTEYQDFEAKLEAVGFTRSIDGPICRWEIDGLLLDVLPIQGDFLGFSSRWFDKAASTAEIREIAPQTKIRTVTQVYLLATKLEAFFDRGNQDFLGSSDLEDIITLVNGFPPLSDNVRTSDADVRTFIASSFKSLLKDPRFIESIPGHLNPEPERTSIVMERLREIASSNEI